MQICIAKTDPDYDELLEACAEYGIVTYPLNQAGAPRYYIDLEYANIGAAIFSLTPVDKPATGITAKLSDERPTAPLGDRIEDTRHGDAERSYFDLGFPSIELGSLGGNSACLAYFPNYTPIDFSAYSSPPRREPSLQEAFEMVAKAAGVSMAPELRAENARLRRGMQDAIDALQRALDGDDEDDE